MGAHFCPVLRGQHVLVSADKSTEVSYINREGGRRSLPLLNLSYSLLLWCSVRFMSLRAAYVMGHLNLGPDLLSTGGPLVREWRFHPFDSGPDLGSVWQGANCTNHFASRVNTHCPLFFSIIDHIAPLGMDVQAHQWPDVLLYAFLSVAMISPVLERASPVSFSDSSGPLVAHKVMVCRDNWSAGSESLAASSPQGPPLTRDSPTPGSVVPSCLPGQS